MSRLYKELECGCLISCDGGGGYIPFTCKDESSCQALKIVRFRKVDGTCSICNSTDCELCNGNA